MEHANEKESIMKNLNLTKTLTLCLAFLGANGTTAWAADVVREDNSDLFVWIFLAFCALIIVAQLIPAALMVMGFAKGVKKGTPATVPVTADQKPATDR
jgi:hypothetical protein